MKNKLVPRDGSELPEDQVIGDAQKNVVNIDDFRKEEEENSVADDQEEIHISDAVIDSIAESVARDISSRLGYASKFSTDFEQQEAFLSNLRLRLCR